MISSFCPGFSFKDHDFISSWYFRYYIFRYQSSRKFFLLLRSDIPFDYRFNLSSFYRFIEILYFWLSQLNDLYVSRNLSISSQVPD